MHKIFPVVLVTAFLISMCHPTREGNNHEENVLFTLLSSEQTKVDFVNKVDDQAEFNVLKYRNYYNGGGVALGDINNDGLVDIYFTANMGSNKLYLNKGNLVFEDITENAGVAGNKPWSTGVTMADVNGDGFLDIYVCNSGDVPAPDRVNELYINNGDLTFKESAAEWGLASDAFSTHASFFDYDQDGDLDCYLLNNSFRSPDRVELYQKSRTVRGEEGGDRLYRNEGSRFIDVTDASGINSGDIGFGLGVSVSDLNGDLFPDIYVSNDFWERDYLYINNGDGTFIDQLEDRLAKTSMNSMGADISDVNNDGFAEIITTDMLPPDNYRLKTMTQFQPYRMGTMKFDSVYHHQVMQNCLQLNDGNGNFQEMAHLAGVAESDWSWGALILDLDLDGWKDIFVSNGIQRDLTDFDFVDIITNKAVVDKIVEENRRFDFRDFLPFMPANKVSNCAFMNQKNLTFTNMSEQMGLATPSFSNGSVYGDLDNDGDADLVINNANMECFIYRNNAVENQRNNFLKIQFNGPKGNSHGIGARVMINKGGKQQVLQHFLSRGFQSSVAPGLFFGLGKTDAIDSVQIIWPDGKMQVLESVKANQTLTMNHAEANLYWLQSKTPGTSIFIEEGSNAFVGNTKHTENMYNDFLQDPMSYKTLSMEGPKIISGDVNGDGLTDIVLLGAGDDPNKLFIQKQDGLFYFIIQPSFVADKALESTCGAFLDIDSDGDQDLLIGHGGNEMAKGNQNFAMRAYKNDGKGNFSLDVESTPHVSGNLSCIVPCDFDADGDEDLFIGARSVPSHYGLVPSSFLLLNNGNSTWSNVTTEEFGRLGMVTGAVTSDVDKDGDQDLIVVGDWMPITIFENTPGALTKKGIIKNSFGWWSSIIAKDLDGDGNEEFILGNWGLNSKMRATAEKPLKLYLKDFDRNGSVDKILEWYPSGDTVAYPFISKDDITKFIPQLQQKIAKYADYGNMTYAQLFDESQRQGALELRTTTLESSILWRDDSGFRLEALPFEAQVAPVYSILSEDMDGDGIMDILLFGNHYGLKPEMGRMDANRGVFLKGDGNKKFHALTASESGMFITGQVRDSRLIEGANGEKRLIISRNNEAALLFQLQDQ
jgi:enediyne biosynthesis protein E4